MRTRSTDVGDKRVTVNGAARDGRVGRLRLLTDAARRINADLPEDELLQVVSDVARQVIGAHQAMISVATGDDLAHSVSAISLSEKYAAWRDYDEEPDGSGIYSRVVRDGLVMRLTQEELEAHPEYRHFGLAAGRHPPLRGWLAVPLCDRDGASIGLLQLSDKHGGDFDEEDEELVVHLAQLAALAIEGSRTRQEAIHASVLLEALQFAAPVGFALFDERLRFVRVNEALAEMTGVRVEQHVGRTPAEVLPGLAEQLEPGLRRVLATGKPAAPVEVSGVTPASPEERRHWLISHYPVEAPGMHAIGSVMIDVTDRRLAAERMWRSEERYRSLVETTQDLIWSVDAEGRFEFVSGAVESIYGYTAEELIGRAFIDFVPPEHREGHLSRFASGIDGSGSEGEAELVRKDGTVRTVEYRCIPLTDERGNVVAITGASTDVTEWKRSERALRESEERFRGLFEEAAIGMALMDSDGGFVQANRAFCKLLGRSQEELRALAWVDVVHPDDREIAGARRARQLAGESELRGLETRFVHSQGHSVWARVMGACVRDADGNLPYTLVQAIDLTEQRRLEEATSRLHALSRDLFCTAGFDGYMKSVNPAWERALGYSPDELLSRPFLEFVHEHDRQRTLRGFELLKGAREMTLKFENRYVHKDGSVRWLLWSINVSPGDELVYGVAKDVTERKRSEERLRQSERKYRDLVETSSDLIWSVDASGRFTFVNRAARRIFGYEPEEMLGRPVADFESGQQRLKDEDALRSVLAGAPLFNYETRRIRKDGRAVDVSVNAIVLHGEDGLVLGATGTATDVTDRKRFEVRQAALAELGRRALEDVPLETFTAAAVALVSETLGLEFAEVLELLPGGRELKIHAAAGWPQEAVGGRFPGGHEDSHAGYAIKVEGPVVVEDFAEERRFIRPAALVETGVRSGVCVTIEGETGPFGVLCGHSKRRRSFSADEVNFLQAVANVLATAIGRKRTEERIVQLAAARGRLVAQTLAAEDRARRSISEILHDHALQDLLASRQDLVEVIEEPEGDLERVVRAREGIERAVQLLREAVFNLHPVVLEHAGLASAIRAVADHQGRRGGFECTIDVAAGATGVHDELILSLVRELLTNVAKHARAEKVRVDVQRDGWWVELVVEDDGRGIEPGRREQALYEGHVGLASSSERVEALAGAFEVGSSREGGTRARALLPARRAAAHRTDRPNGAGRVSERRRASGR